jgi:hypothetical protein
MKQGFLIVLVLATAMAPPAWDSPRDVRRRPSGCAQVDSHTVELTAFALNLMQDTTDGSDAVRQNLHLVSVDSSLVHQVKVDSLCVKAAQLITVADSELASRTHYVYLISVGSVYLAQDPGISYGEWSPVFSMDSALSVVYGAVGQ